MLRYILWPLFVSLARFIFYVAICLVFTVAIHMVLGGATVVLALVSPWDVTPASGAGLFLLSLAVSFVLAVILFIYLRYVKFK